MYTVAIIPSTVGYHWEEIFAPFKVFKDESWDVAFYTVNGDAPVADPKSIEQHLLLSYFGMGTRPSFSPDSPLGKQLTAALAKSRPIGELDVDKIDIIYIPGGHGCLFDVNVDPSVHAKIAEAFTKNKLIGAVCHGSSSLAFVNVDGAPIIKGKRVIGFLDSMDFILMKLGLIDQKFLPFPYWNEDKLREAGAIISVVDQALAMTNPAYYEVDAPFVTGVGPKAARNVALKLLNMAHEKIG